MQYRCTRKYNVLIYYSCYLSFISPNVVFVFFLNEFGVSWKRNPRILRATQIPSRHVLCNISHVHDVTPVTAGTRYSVGGGPSMSISLAQATFAVLLFPLFSCHGPFWAFRSFNALLKSSCRGGALSLSYSAWLS